MDPARAYYFKGISKDIKLTDITSGQVDELEHSVQQLLDQGRSIRAVWNPILVCDMTICLKERKLILVMISRKPERRTIVRTRRSPSTYFLSHVKHWNPLRARLIVPSVKHVIVYSSVMLNWKLNWTRLYRDLMKLKQSWLYWGSNETGLQKL